MLVSTIFGSRDMTSIKVPRALRDRLSVRAAAQHPTLAGALSSVLDDGEAQLFWSMVRSENSPSARERGLERERFEQDQLERGQFDTTLGDDLTDPADNEIGTDW